ncbi:hypothetical protein DEO72_LG8g2786 [Vigna unguiculata]|uniref:Uncharacterized protein n=1 Tax=Vigna unguiculata TaxID=3917 RepID=A0A4D6MUD4_VIGUN|nr:hypothetical protein DEO72_LG8g2786 [Vigna unguiculata]
MNLPAHIITCSPPSMNLPAHGTTSHDPSIASPLKSNARKSQLQHYRLAQPKRRQAKPAQTAWRYQPHCQAPSSRQIAFQTLLVSNHPTITLLPYISFLGPFILTI